MAYTALTMNSLCQLVCPRVSFALQEHLDLMGCFCRRAEAVSGLPFDSHQLLHNGKVLSGRPLAEYGVHKGSVLELVPYEPFIPQPMPEGSPLLSSPDHELVGSPTPNCTDDICSAASIASFCTGTEIHTA